MMTDRDTDKVERVHRITFPTASFSLPRRQIDWIERQAAKLGVNKRSEFMRTLIEKAMKDEEAAA